jgi:hypothetical protein
MDLRGNDRIPVEILSGLSSQVAQELADLGPFKPISSQDIKQMLAMEAMKQMLGCDDSACLAEIGGALGADYMVGGSVMLLGESYLTQMQLMNIRHSRAENRVSREYTGGPKGLFDDVRVAAKLLVRDILAQESGTLNLRVSEEGATIKVDGTIVGVSPMPPFQVAGGMHTVAAEKAGFILFRRDVAIVAEKESLLEAQLAPSAEFRRQYQEEAGWTRTLAWTGIGVGGASLVLTGVLFGVAEGRAQQLRVDSRRYNRSKERREEDLLDLNEREAAVGTLDSLVLTSGVVGAAALAVGVVLFVTGDDPHRYQGATSVGLEESARSSAPEVSLGVTPGGFALFGSF